MNPKRCDLWRDLGVADEDGVNEVVDLTSIDKRCIDIENEDEAKPVYIESITSTTQELTDVDGCASGDTKEMLPTQMSNCIAVSPEKQSVNIPVAAVSDSNIGIKPDAAISSSVQEQEKVGYEANRIELIDCTGNDYVISPAKGSTGISEVEASHDDIEIKPDAMRSSSALEVEKVEAGSIPDGFSNSKTPSPTLQQESCSNEIKTVAVNALRPQPKEEHLYILTAHVKMSEDAVNFIEQYLSKQVKPIIKHWMSQIREDTILSDCRRKFEYEDLEKRYLTPRVIKKPQLVGGMTIRKKLGDRYIDKPTARFRKLRAKIDSLLKQRKLNEVHTILRELHKWESNPSWDKVWRDLGVDDEEDAEELVDLTLTTRTNLLMHTPY